MKIIRLAADNIKRLVAVEIKPDGTLITVGGKNGAGKSSVLDSIAYALGGKDLVPSEPIRAGEAEAKIVVDLGDFVVTRTFTRSKTREIDGTEVPDDKGFVLGNKITWGETKSTLKVANREGASYPSPQSLLDGLLGKLSFDPLQFAHSTAKEQNETLRRLVKLDTSTYDEARKVAADQRAMAKKTLAAMDVRLNDLPTFSGVPTEEVSIQAVTDELLKARELQRVAEEADVVLARAVVEEERARYAFNETVKKIDELRNLLKMAEKEAEERQDVHRLIKEDMRAKQTVFDEAKAAVPDFSAIDATMKEHVETNRKVRANQTHRAHQIERDKLAKKISDFTADIERAEREKQVTLSLVVFPVPGLGLSDSGVTFNGVPFDQASTSEQIRVSVAIGLALNPKLKVLLIRNGNALDRSGIEAITQQAKDADAQLWMEWVAETKDGVAVMLEDGSVI